MALPYAVEHLTNAVHALAGDDAVATRLQRAWTDHVQHLWETKCLPPELNERFRSMWGRYTVKDEADPHTTALRPTSPDELTAAARDLVQLALDTVAADARDELPG